MKNAEMGRISALKTYGKFSELFTCSTNSIPLRSKSLKTFMRAIAICAFTRLFATTPKYFLFFLCFG
jgi:hypothetical protein